MLIVFVFFGAGWLFFDEALALEYYDFEDDSYGDEDDMTLTSYPGSEVTRVRRQPEPSRSEATEHLDQIKDALHQIMPGKRFDDWDEESSPIMEIAIPRRPITHTDEYNYESTTQNDYYLTPKRSETIANTTEVLSYQGDRVQDIQGMPYGHIPDSLWGVSESALELYASRTTMYVEPTRNVAPTRSTRETTADREREELQAYMNNMTASAEDSAWNDQQLLEPIEQEVLRGPASTELLPAHPDPTSDYYINPKPSVWTSNSKEDLSYQGSTVQDIQGSIYGHIPDSLWGVSESELEPYDSSTAMYVEPTSNVAPTRSTRETAADREREELQAYMNNMTSRALTASKEDSGRNDQHPLEPIDKAVLRGTAAVGRGGEDETPETTTDNGESSSDADSTTVANTTAANTTAGADTPTGTLPLCVTTTTTTTTTKKKTTRPFDIEKFLDIIANLTYDYYSNLTDQVNETLHRMGIPTCGTPSTTAPPPTTTEPKPVDYAAMAEFLIGKCFVCGLEDTGIPYNANCADAFAGDFLPLVPQDPRAKGLIARYKKYCRYKDVNNFELNATMPRSLFGRWTGGCSVRWTDLSGVYTQRACRNRRQAATGRHFASKRMAKLEMALANTDNGCIISPVASLLPLSRGISLFARFHACVCTGNWCNGSARADSDVRVTAVTLMIWMNGLIRKYCAVF